MVLERIGKHRLLEPVTVKSRLVTSPLEKRVVVNHTVSYICIRTAAIWCPLTGYRSVTLSFLSCGWGGLGLRDSSSVPVFRSSSAISTTAASAACWRAVAMRIGSIAFLSTTSGTWSRSSGSWGGSRSSASSTSGSAIRQCDCLVADHAWQLDTYNVAVATDF